MPFAQFPWIILALTQCNAIQIISDFFLFLSKFQSKFLERAWKIKMKKKDPTNEIQTNCEHQMEGSQRKCGAIQKEMCNKLFIDSM